MDSDDTPIIVNEDALTEAFIPTRLLHRESQIGELERGIEAGPGTTFELRTTFDTRNWKSPLFFF